MTYAELAAELELPPEQQAEWHAFVRSVCAEHGFARPDWKPTLPAASRTPQAQPPTPARYHHAGPERRRAVMGGAKQHSSRARRGRLRIPGLVDEIGKPPADKGDEVDARGDKQHDEIQVNALSEVELAEPSPERLEPSPEPLPQRRLGLRIALGLFGSWRFTRPCSNSFALTYGPKTSFCAARYASRIRSSRPSSDCSVNSPPAITTMARKGSPASP